MNDEKETRSDHLVPIMLLPMLTAAGYAAAFVAESVYCTRLGVSPLFVEISVQQCFAAAIVVAVFSSFCFGFAAPIASTLFHREEEQSDSGPKVVSATISVAALIAIWNIGVSPTSFAWTLAFVLSAISFVNAANAAGWSKRYPGQVRPQPIGVKFLRTTVGDALALVLLGMPAILFAAAGTGAWAAVYNRNLTVTSKGEAIVAVYGDRVILKSLTVSADGSTARLGASFKILGTDDLKTSTLTSQSFRKIVID